MGRDCHVNVVLYLGKCMYVFFLSFIFSLLISFTSDKSEPVWHGYVYCISLVLVSMSTTLCKNLYYYKDQVIMLQLKTSLMAAVYNKVMSNAVYIGLLHHEVLTLTHLLKQ